LQHLTRTLHNLTRPLCRTHANVIACRCRALPNLPGSIDGMQSDQISRALTRALRNIARTLPGTLPDISAPASNIAARTAPLLLRSGLAGSLIWRRAVRPCTRLTLAICAHRQDQQSH